jgi:hypothetical protein
MNRRDFLGLFRGLAVLPFIKIPALPTPAEPSPDTSPIRLGHFVSGDYFTSGQVVYIDDHTGKLDSFAGTGHIIGLAARDIAAGEVIEWRIGGNSKDIITYGIAKIT